MIGAESIASLTQRWACGFVVALACAAGAQGATTIDVGTHFLLPHTPGQTIQF